MMIEIGVTAREKRAVPAVATITTAEITTLKEALAKKGAGMPRALLPGGKRIRRWQRRERKVRQGM